MLEHRTLSLAEQVFERLEGEILSSKYQRGELLTEMRLVSDLGVSRTPVREALHRLEQEHLIEISTKGILVVGVTQKDLEDIFAIRLRIEGLASREAALNITNEQIAELLETARSVSLSWGAREVGSPCEWRGGARHCSRAMGGDSGLV